MLNIINDLNLKAQTNSLNINEQVTKRVVDVSLAKLISEEEIKWALRAKVGQVVQGDNNTQFSI